MGLSLVLIDDQGTCWNGHSRELRAAFDSPYSGGEFVDYAVINLGFIAINVYGNSFQLRLRPSLVKPRAVTALANRLEAARVERVVLTWFGSDWSNELIASHDATMKRITELVRAGQNSNPADFLVREADPTASHLNPAIGQILSNWQRLGTPNGQHQLMSLLQATFGDRYVVVKRDQKINAIVFHELGEGLFSKYETWRSCAVGAPVEEQPDRTYGRWIAGTYMDAINSGQPRLEDIDAIVRWPHAGRTRLRYKRLLVPLKRPGQETMLLSASLMDNRVDLRAVNG